LSSAKISVYDWIYKSEISRNLGLATKSKMKITILELWIDSRYINLWGKPKIIGLNG